MLMLVILGIACWLGWITNKARGQSRAVEAIQECGGIVHYDFEAVKGNALPGREPSAPRWLRRLVGDAYFQDVVGVYLANARSSCSRDETSGRDDRILSELEHFPQLSSLMLHEKQATDAGLAHIRALTKLEYLVLLDATELTDVGVAHLPGLKHLKTLLICRSKMTDAGLASLKDLTRLESLSLQENHSTDRGLAQLKNLKNLKELRLGLGGNRFTDEGLAHLEPLRNLESLDLQGSPITDKGLVHLKALPKLREIWMYRTLITDEGLKMLQNLKSALR
jgi:Leucine-rich repeat (LRR) protein